MASTLITSVGLCASRVSLLTSGGAPYTGADHGYVSHAPTKLDVTVVTKAGVDEDQENGCGVLMGVLNTDDQIKAVEFGISYCQLDAALIGLKTGASVIYDGSDIKGLELPAVGGTRQHVCYEGWSKAWELDHQLTDTLTDPDGTYIHWVFPDTNWVQDKFTLESKLLVVDLKGKGRENPNITANGPFDDWPSYIANRGGITRLGGWFYDDGPPAADGEYVTVTSIAS